MPQAFILGQKLHTQHPKYNQQIKPITILWDPAVPYFRYTPIVPRHLEIFSSGLEIFIRMASVIRLAQLPDSYLVTVLMS